MQEQTVSGPKTEQEKGKVIKMQLSVESSMVNNIEYRSAKNELVVEFKGGARYLYEHIPAHIVLRLVDADNESVGKFLHAEILRNRDKYPFTRIS